MNAKKTSDKKNVVQVFPDGRVTVIRDGVKVESHGIATKVLLEEDDGKNVLGVLR